MLKAILFDLDGTLTDSDQFHFQVFKNFFALHGISLNRSLYRQKITGSQNIAILAEFLPHVSTTAGKVFSTEKEESFRRLAKGQITPLPGLMAFLQTIQARGLATAVVTNAPPENADFMLGELGLSNRFSPVIIGDDLPRGKPDPLPYQTALNRLGLRPEEAIAFEDSRAGVRSAVGAGIKTIGMTTTHSSEELLEIGVAKTIANFSDPFIRTLL